MLTVLTWSDFKSFEDPTDDAGALCELLVDEVLKTRRVAKKECLDSFRHINLIIITIKLEGFWGFGETYVHRKTYGVQRPSPSLDAEPGA